MYLGERRNAFEMGNADVGPVLFLCFVCGRELKVPVVSTRFENYTCR